MRPEGEALRYSGPVLPFDHDDVRVYIDNLFTDGLLIPTQDLASSLVEGTWMAVGVAASEDADHLGASASSWSCTKPIAPQRSSSLDSGGYSLGRDGGAALVTAERYRRRA